MNDGKYYSQVRSEMLGLIDFSSTYPIDVLDVGAGDGGFINTLRNNLSVNVSWAIEPTSVYCKINATNVLNMTVEDALEHLPDNHFDLIVFNDVLEHLVDPWFVLKEVKRCIKPSGKIIISLPNFLFIHTFKTVIAGDFKYQDFGVLDKTHLRFFTKKSVIRMVEECGYKVELIHGVNGFYSWKYRLLNIITFGLIKDWFHQQWACRIKG